MSFKIIKFGGSSIADAEKIQHVAGIIENTKKNSELAIVVSAFGGVTDAIKTVAESAAIGKDIDVIFDSLVTCFSNRRTDPIGNDLDASSFLSLINVNSVLPPPTST